MVAGRWLRHSIVQVAELPQYRENFLRNDIDGPSLLALTKKELQVRVPARGSVQSEY